MKICVVCLCYAGLSLSVFCFKQETIIYDINIDKVNKINNHISLIKLII